MFVPCGLLLVVERRNSDKKWNGDGFYLPVIGYSIRGGRLCKLLCSLVIDGGSVCGGLEDFQDFQSLKLLARENGKFITLLLLPRVLFCSTTEYSSCS